jgi:deoxyribonuclease V
MRDMILAVDVHYIKTGAVIGGVGFDHWHDQEARKEFISLIDEVACYESGKFYKREFPCILHLITEHHLEPECIVVDGFVYLDGFSEAGLGKYLFDALGGIVPIIGLAKTRYRNIGSNYEVYRGASKKPLYVTSVGIDLEQAKENIVGMHGKKRLPTLIKQVDQICRGVKTAG